MKLSKAQKEVIRRMREGDVLWYREVDECFILINSRFCFAVNKNTAKSLLRIKLIIKTENGDCECFLTEAGRTINID